MSLFSEYNEILDTKYSMGYWSERGTEPATFTIDRAAPRLGEIDSAMKIGLLCQMIGVAKIENGKSVVQKLYR